MKKLVLSLLALLLTTLCLNAQEVKHNNEFYIVKGDKILKNKADITTELNEVDKTAILLKAKKVRELNYQNEKLVKDQKKIEKDRKRAEKKQKQAEKELKKQQKAKDNLEKAERDYKKTVNKYEKLKRKGKLSPMAEENWLDKIEKLQTKLDKAKKKL